MENLIVTMTSGTFNEQVGIVPTNTSNGWTFRISFIVKRTTNKTNKDDLRVTISYESASEFDPDNDTLIIYIDQTTPLQIGPGDWTKIDKKKQKLSYLEKPTVGKEKTSLKLDTVKRQITLRRTNTNLPSSAISDNPVIQVEFGTFNQTNELGLTTKTKGTKETLWY